MTKAVELSRAEEFVNYALGIGALKLVPEGLKLKSGRISPYFFNTGLFDTGDSISHLADAYAATIRGFDPEVIFGPAYKGITLAAATAMAINGNIGFAFNRKEEKNHAERGTLVGASLAGKKVVIIDDVMTTGDSSREAVEIVLAYGGTPVACVIAFDRQERMEKIEISAVQDFQFTLGIPVRSIATIADLISFLKKTTNGSYEDSIFRGKMIGKILAYQKKYGTI